MKKILLVIFLATIFYSCSDNAVEQPQNPAVKNNIMVINYVDINDNSYSFECVNVSYDYTENLLKIEFQECGIVIPEPFSNIKTYNIYLK